MKKIILLIFWIYRIHESIKKYYKQFIFALKKDDWFKTDTKVGEIRTKMPDLILLSAQEYIIYL